MAMEPRVYTLPRPNALYRGQMHFTAARLGFTAAKGAHANVGRAPCAAARPPLPLLPLYLDPLINAVCWTQTGVYRGQASLETGVYRGQTALYRGQASLETGVYRGQASHKVVFTAAKPP